MAKMIPDQGPRDRDGNLEKSRESVIYEALATLPDDFWIIHSYKMVTVKQRELKEREADFIVFHKELGILCIEAKAGNVSYRGDKWYYGNGKPMHNNGPYEQAAKVKYSIMDRFRECGCGDLVDSCKIMSAVWFPSIRQDTLKDIGLASDADRAITLSYDDLANPEPKIRTIFDINTYGKVTELSKEQAQRVIERVLCPTLNIVPTSRFEYDIADVVFIRLLESQRKVLDFIEDQRSVAIKGAAGTGKTLIATEYAKRMSDLGEKALYLCRTSLLANDIKSRLKNSKNADAFTIDSFADFLDVKEGGINRTCEALAEKLMQIWEAKTFPYDHVIIDEGQDFGDSAIEENGIVDLLYSLVKDRPYGTMYMFYDDKQKSQANTLPDFIANADCKLTLHTNCRNSRSIAECAIRGADVSFKQNTRYRASGVPDGGKPQLFVSKSSRDQKDYINDRIAELQEKGLKDIAIVTCKTIKGSVLEGYTTTRRGKTTWFNTTIPFTTYTKFKGMEADAVILVDIDTSVWKMDDSSNLDMLEGVLDNENLEQLRELWLDTHESPAYSNAFYIAASRAKHELSLVCDMDNDECATLVRMLCGKPGKNPTGKLAKLLRAERVR